MGLSVSSAALADHVEDFGSTAYLVTVGTEDRPHVVAVTVAWRGATLVVGAGRTTTANVERRPDVTLVWAARPGAGYSLIVDGSARPPREDAGALDIEPRKAVLHRTPEGDPSAPSCITVLARS